MDIMIVCSLTYYTELEHAEMYNLGMTHLKALLDDPAGLVAIHPRFEILAIALKSAVAVEYTLEKADNPYNHILDVMRMAASYFQYDFKQKQQQTPRPIFK
jgi:hypothetical protein